MIQIGAIKRMWKGWRILFFAYVSNNSPLKSQYFMLETCQDGNEYVKVGKGILNNEQRNYPVLKLYVHKWSICRYMFGGESVVVLGIGKWDEECWPPKSK